MKLLLGTLCLVTTSLLLLSCAQNHMTNAYVRSSYTYDYTRKEVSNLRRTLKNTKFPQEDGYVESLLKTDQSGYGHRGMLASVADLIPNNKGIIAVYTLTYSLNDDYTLIVHQDHYEAERSPLKTEVTDSRAEIVKYKSRHED